MPGLRSAASIIVCLLGVQALATEPLTLPPELCLACEPAEQRLLADLADGRLDEHTVLAAALIAGGAEEAVVNDCCARLEKLAARWRSSGTIAGTTRQRAERLFELLHRELLTGGYQAEANDVAQTIQQGTYNCLSATIVWQHLSGEFDIPAVARQLPGHVQSVLAEGPQREIVELTCPEWFSMIDAEDHPLAQIEGRDLDEAALVASVYYNRGLALLSQRQFAAALTATYHAHRLDPHSLIARGNLLAILNNWALALAEEGQLRRAVVLLEQGQTVAPEHASFGENLSALRKHDDRRILPP
jgi:hypothetical protein